MRHLMNLNHHLLLKEIYCFFFDPVFIIIDFHIAFLSFFFIIIFCIFPIMHTFKKKKKKAYAFHIAYTIVTHQNIYFSSMSSIPISFFTFFTLFLSFFFFLGQSKSKQGAYGKVPIHQRSKLDLIMYPTETWAMIKYKLTGGLNVSLIVFLL